MMRGMSAPGSTTMASPDASSPRMEQLHCSGPTVRISWIILGPPVVRGLAEWPGARGGSPGNQNGTVGGSYFLGADCWVVVVPERTEWSPLERASRTVREIEITMKSAAPQAVSLVSRLAAPRGPNAVCEPCPPNAPARSADLPCCSSTTPIRNRQTMTWMMTRRVIMEIALEPRNLLRC